MTFELVRQGSLDGLPLFKVLRAGNVIQVGQFPTAFSARVCLTGSAAWRLYMYQGSLVRRRWRHGDSVPRPEPEDSTECEVLPGVWS